jgi:type II restriction/modification system DNA methylase subunit YeeA
MTAAEFVAKWRHAELRERAASHEHFIDLCTLLDHPTPATADPVGTDFTFERGVRKTGGGSGWADVWKRGYFGWEYKRKHKNLDAAYAQLLKYRESLESPPLLIVSDIERIVVRTNFTNTPTETFDIQLSDLLQPIPFERLRAAFHDPEKLRPGRTTQAITQDAATKITDIAQGLRSRGFAPPSVARFLDRIVFSMFAENVGLLPEKIFSRIVKRSARDPQRFAQLIKGLFHAMAVGADFGADTIRHFNGDLFADVDVLDLTPEELATVGEVSALDWSALDPAILGTLFERALDPGKRAQLGAHYTSRDDIETIVDPVVMVPLRREWEHVKHEVVTLLQRQPLRPADQTKARSVLRGFVERLQQVSVLDPACGSGNFLYVVLHKLKDLEKEAIMFAMDHGMPGFLPHVGPWQLHAIEVNEYAFELAQMTVWIGWLQWIRANGFGEPTEPILQRLDSFSCRDAIVAKDPKSGRLRDPEWPRVDYIVSNPPFLGGKKLRTELGDPYVSDLFSLWGKRVPHEADLCCYWFEKARAEIAAGKCQRAGLLATQGIRGGANRRVLKRIKETGDVFFAVSDRDWVLDGANVHVSLIGFDNGKERDRTLDGARVQTINANLTATKADLTTARRLSQNVGLSFMGDTKGGAFDFEESTAEAIDFGEMESSAAAKYERPYEYLRSNVYPERQRNKRLAYKRRWWVHVEPRPGMRQALATLPRFIATATVSKHRLFVWLQAPTLPDHQLIVFASSEDYVFGILHSRAHEVWTRSQGTQVREVESGFRYTPTSCFETFPFPTVTADSGGGSVAQLMNSMSCGSDGSIRPSCCKSEFLNFARL